MSGGHAALAVQSPDVSQPKSKPAMLTPANCNFPALEGGVAHEPEGAAAELALVALASTEVALLAAADDAVPGIHCE